MGLKVATLITWLVPLATCTHPEAIYRETSQPRLSYVQRVFLHTTKNTLTSVIQEMSKVLEALGPGTGGKDKYMFLIVISYILSQFLKHFACKYGCQHLSHPDVHMPLLPPRGIAYFLSHESWLALRRALIHRKWQK